MKSILFSIQHGLFSNHAIQQVIQQLDDERGKIKAALTQGYQSEYACLHVVQDSQLLTPITTLVAQKKKLNPALLIVIGIGGSNLGTLAVYQALAGIYANDMSGTLKVYFADTIGGDSTSQLYKLIEQTLQAGATVILNVVSKSGTTTETIINFELFIDLLRAYHPHNYAEYVVVTTDHGSVLWKYAQEYALSCLIIPDKVGGRYSVMSAVGLFPLALLGINIQYLVQGARDMLDQCLTVHQSMAALSAACMVQAYHQGLNINDTFVFPAQLAGIGQWYRQLVGESLGKQYNRAGQEVFTGMTPTVSVGSTDLHSVAQLYLGGPYDKFTTFLSIASDANQLAIPSLPEFQGDLQDKTVKQVLDAILRGVQLAYAHAKRPFVSIVLPEKNSYYCGQLLQWKMLEVIYGAALLGINPFDQPQVELYKQETRKILRNE
jgi:glucose-6-phosphate isomerase